MAELDEILAGQDPQPRGEDGRWVSTDTPEETAATPAVPEPTPEPEKVEDPAPIPIAEPVEDRIPAAALLDERRKRQERDRENQELRDQLRQLQERPAQPENVPDLFEKPDERLTLVEQRARQSAIEEMERRMLNREANKSERQARKKWTDYDDRRAVFEARIKSDPVLASEFHRSVIQGDDDLGEFVYETVGKIQKMEQLRDPNYLKTFEAEIEARVRKELSAAKPPVPQSLNATPSPASTTETWSGPPPLEAILKRT